MDTVTLSTTFSPRIN